MPFTEVSLNKFILCNFSSIKKVAASALCLRDVLKKHSIIMLMNRYEEEKIDHLFGYLEPFKPNKKKKVKYTGSYHFI